MEELRKKIHKILSEHYKLWNHAKPLRLIMEAVSPKDEHEYMITNLKDILEICQDTVFEGDVDRIEAKVKGILECLEAQG